MELLKVLKIILHIISMKCIFIYFKKKHPYLCKNAFKDEVMFIHFL